MPVKLINCVAESNGGSGFVLGPGSSAEGCQSYRNGGAGFVSGDGVTIANSKAAANAQGGFVDADQFEQIVSWSKANLEIDLSDRAIESLRDLVNSHGRDQKENAYVRFTSIIADHLQIFPYLPFLKQFVEAHS